MVLPMLRMDIFYLQPLKQIRQTFDANEFRVGQKILVRQMEFRESSVALFQSVNHVHITEYDAPEIKFISRSTKKWACVYYRPVTANRLIVRVPFAVSLPLHYAVDTAAFSYTIVAKQWETTMRKARSFVRLIHRPLVALLASVRV